MSVFAPTHEKLRPPSLGTPARARGSLLEPRRAPSPAPQDLPPMVQEVLRSPGQPLDARARALMEPRFGHDFSRVRVHADPAAAQSARALGAAAYTVGQDVVFGTGSYRPAAGAGARQLLAHELAHVVQQERGGGTPEINPRAAHERDADQAARAAVSGNGRVLVGAATGAGIARAPLGLPGTITTPDLSPWANQTPDLSKWSLARLEAKLQEIQAWRDAQVATSSDTKRADVAIAQIQSQIGQIAQARTEAEAVIAGMERTEKEDEEVAPPRGTRRQRQNAVPQRPTSLFTLTSEDMCQGRCFTDEMIDPALAAAQKQRRAEEAAQERIRKRWEGKSDQQLDAKIDELRAEPVRPRLLEQLEKERARRRDLRRQRPVTGPTATADAIQMLAEAWRDATKEDVPDLKRDLELVSRVEEWLERVASPENYDRYFTGMTRTSIMVMLGQGKAEVKGIAFQLRAQVDRGGRYHPIELGGHWELALNAIKAEREALEVMGNEKRLAATSIAGLQQTENRILKYEAAGYAAVVAAPVVIGEGAGLLAGEGVVASGLGRGAVWLAPRATTWLALHPGTTIAVVGAGVTTAEEYKETGSINPLNALLNLGHIYLGYQGDVGLQRTAPTGGSPVPEQEPVPAPGPASPPRAGLGAGLALKLKLAMGQAGVGLGEAIPATADVSAGRATGPVPALVTRSGPADIGPDVTPTTPAATGAAVTPASTAPASVAPASNLPATPSAIPALPRFSDVTQASEFTSPQAVASPGTAASSPAPLASTVTATSGATQSPQVANIASAASAIPALPRFLDVTQGSSFGAPAAGPVVAAQTAPAAATPAAAQVANASTARAQLRINIYTSTRSFRRQLVAFFRANPNHPLRALYDPQTGRLRASTQAGMDEFYWFEHPEAVQAGHVTSSLTGAPDKIVIMTAWENQMLKSTIEGKGAGASIRGGFSVAIIDGLPISVESAKHMIAFGKLDPAALANATIVNVDDL